MPLDLKCLLSCSGYDDDEHLKKVMLSQVLVTSIEKHMLKLESLYIVVFYNLGVIEISF